MNMSTDGRKANGWEAAFEKFAAVIHQDHRLASGQPTWHTCEMQPCWTAQRLVRAPSFRRN